MLNTCKNCQAKFTGKFCNQCGQKASVGELKLHDVVHEAWHSITHTDSGILKLAKDLFIRPKSVYLNYFAGQRKKYFSPVTFFLITVAVLLFLGVKVFDYEDYRLKVLNEFGRYALLETKFKTLLLLPLEIAITWLFFRQRYNLAKHIVFWLYLNGFLFVVKIVLTPLYFAFIFHKSFFDVSIQLLQYLLMYIHLVLVFGNRKWTNVLLLLILVNVIYISEYLLTGYLLFDHNFFKQAGVDNLWQLIWKAYQL